MDKGKIKNFLAPNKEKLILFLIGSILFLAPLLWFWLKIHKPIGEIQIQIPLLLQILFWISVGTGLFVLYIGVCHLAVEMKKDKRVIPTRKRIILVLSYWFYGAVALSIWWFLLKNKISFLIFFFLFIIGGVIVLFFVSRFLKIPFK